MLVKAHSEMDRSLMAFHQWILGILYVKCLSCWWIEANITSSKPLWRLVDWGWGLSGSSNVGCVCVCVCGGWMGRSIFLLVSHLVVTTIPGFQEVVGWSGAWKSNAAENKRCRQRLLQIYFWKKGGFGWGPSLPLPPFQSHPRPSSAYCSSLLSHPRPDVILDMWLGALKGLRVRVVD